MSQYLGILRYILNDIFTSKNMIFSQMKNNKSVLFSLLISDITLVVFIVSLTDADPTSVFLTPLTSLFLSKTIKCWYAFSQLECKEHFGKQDYFNLPKPFVFVSPVVHMLSTERGCHDVYVFLVMLVMMSEACIGV